MDTYQAMSDTEFMQIYRSRYWHDGTLKARLDQQALGTGYKANTAGEGEASKIAAERVRRGLTFPQSWIAAGLRTAEEDF